MSWSSVRVPTVERGFPEAARWETAMAAERPVEMGDLGPPELAQETAGVGREGFHIAPLGLPEDDIERQRGFPRARDAGDDREPAARDLDVDPAEVVLGRPPDDDAVVESVLGRVVVRRPVVRRPVAPRMRPRGDERL